VAACCRGAPFRLLPRVVDAASLSLDGPAIGLNVISSPLDAEEEEGGTARRDEVADCGRDIPEVVRRVLVVQCPTLR
jgi:hypothetical protein